ncbi:hypothetical protein HPB50_024204 [Hyalomma asiaticum]|uniref:Uncharacterized protein n=1 Tax=Hyalomma asiaticum TaxID=266040 RepID=A0ACB7SQD9_HYAAI|nr:hypothetical protein HPB50_024204 [Hyalomma asiaticum]
MHLAQRLPRTARVRSHHASSAIGGLCSDGAAADGTDSQGATSYIGAADQPRLAAVALPHRAVSSRCMTPWSPCGAALITPREPMVSSIPPHRWHGHSSTLIGPTCLSSSPTMCDVVIDYATEGSDNQ